MAGKGRGSIVSKETIDVDGLEVLVVRKRIKNLHLRIKDPGGQVSVSMPQGMPLSKAEQLVRDNRAWIERNRKRLQGSPRSIAAQASGDEQAQWKAVVSACVPPLIEAWEPILGVKAGKLAYRNMTSRWGSCQPSTGRICINTRLALYPPECLEYVVVHELCHLLVHGHGPEFHRLMDACMPDWRQRKARLR